VIELCELFESIQGEGPNVGEPCLFVRLSGCRLRCEWCDSRYAWEHAGAESVDPTALAVRIRAAGPRRLVLTGGEPLEQQPALVELLPLLPPELVLEVETNGTHPPRAELLARVAQWNVSPKLRSSGQPLAQRLAPQALQPLRDTGRAWLKLVVHTDADIEEAAELVTQLDWPAERVALMPLADTRTQYRTRAPKVAEAALALGYRFSPRLQLELWDGRRGR
jgi:7-carboxy-7-deazaguanine synthase